MLFDEGEQDAASLIDCQGFGIGCGMYDVAFFLATSVTSELRHRIERDILDEYHDIVSDRGAENYTREDCWRQLPAEHPGHAHAHGHRLRRAGHERSPAGEADA